MRATLAFRLLMSFLIVVLLTVTVGVTGVITLKAAADRAERSYQHATLAIAAAEAMESAFLRTRLAVYRGLAVGTPAVLGALATDIAALEAEWSAATDRYGQTLETEADQQRFADYRGARQEYSGVISTVLPLVVARKNEQALAFIAEKGYASGQTLMQVLAEVLTDSTTKAKALAVETQEVSDLVTWYLVGLTLVGALVGIVAGLGITRWVTKAVGGEPSAIAEVAETIALGVLDIEWEASRRPSTGIRASMEKMTSTLASRSALLEALSRGDLTQRVDVVSERDTLGQSVDTLTKSLSETLCDIRRLSEATLAEARQVSAASHALSEATVEQSAALEQVGASLSEVAGHTRENAGRAGNASLLAGIVQQTAQEGKDHVAELVAGMDVVRNSGDQVEAIAKAIDDIAFQINLLALNANIEAARAGAAGRGFAVVADEVRNLARRSSEAAREASQRITRSRTEIGAMDSLVKTAADRWVTALEGTAKLAGLVDEITQQTQAQAAALKQIETGLRQIDQSTQANAANSEETASSAETLTQQAEQVQTKVSFFRLLDEACPPGI